jgi:hypothetical protein
MILTRINSVVYQFKAMWYLIQQEIIMRRRKYNHQPGKDYVAGLGMFWDEAFADVADPIAREHGLDQKAWDEMVRQYAWRVKCLFDPRLYPYWQRIKIACHFLNPFSKG